VVDNLGVQAAIDQLLFGYRDGHELLAGSLDVDARLEADLLPHADGRFDDESDHYLVGLRVEALQRFMLTRIWPAPELPRPGAVWAHSLLIDDRALEFIDPLLLANYFRRPKPDEFEPYRSSLEIAASGLSLLAEVPDELLTALCEVAYEGGDGQTVVIWPDEIPSETGLLALWRRLPLPLRRSYSFRSRGRARTGSSPYAVQVASQLTGRSASQGVRVLWPAELEPRPPITLLASASRDPSHPLGAALDLYAESSNDALFLADMWNSIAAGDALGVAASLETASGFSARLELEQALFGSPAGHPPLWELSESERVFTLLEGGGPDLDRLLPATRLPAAWASDREKALDLLDDRADLAEPAARLLLVSAVGELTGNELLQRVNDTELFLAALAERDDLPSDPRIWPVLEKSSNRELRRAALARADAELPEILIANECWGLLGEALEDESAFAVTVGLLARTHPTDPSLWNKLLEGRWTQLVAFLRTSPSVEPPALVLAAASLPRRCLDDVPIARWLDAGPLIHDREDMVAVTAAARLLALSLGNDSEPARRLLIECFGPTHRALESGELPPKAGKELKAILPDRKAKSLPKRLNQAIIASMESSKWSQLDLRRALAPAGPEAHRLVKLVSKKHPLRRRIESTLKDLEELLPLGG
jgi:hypothetical protein